MTLRFAQAWDDLRIEPVARTTGANAPTFEKWFDDVAGTSRGVYLYSFDDAAAGSEKEVFFTMQMPHDWLEGSDLYVHVHWVGNVDDTNATPRWGLEYCWRDINAEFGDTTFIYATGQVGGAVDVTARRHVVSSFAAITPGSAENNISGVLIGRLFRNSSDAADTYNAGGNKCGLLYIDAHYQRDGSGSIGEFSKGIE